MYGRNKDKLYTLKSNILSITIIWTLYMIDIFEIYLFLLLKAIIFWFSDCMPKERKPTTMPSLSCICIMLLLQSMVCLKNYKSCIILFNHSACNISAMLWWNKCRRDTIFRRYTKVRKDNTANTSTFFSIVYINTL